MAQKMCFVFEYENNPVLGQQRAQKVILIVEQQSKQMFYTHFPILRRWTPNVCSTTTWDMLTRGSEPYTSALYHVFSANEQRCVL